MRNIATEARFQKAYCDLVQGLLNTKLVNMCKVNMKIVSRKLKWLVVVQLNNGRLYSPDTERNIKRIALLYSDCYVYNHTPLKDTYLAAQ